MKVVDALINRNRRAPNPKTVLMMQLSRLLLITLSRFLQMVSVMSHQE